MAGRDKTTSLGGSGNPEAQIVVAVVGIRIVAIRHAAILRRIVPGAAAVHAVRASMVFALVPIE